MIPIYLDSSTNFSATVLLQLYTVLNLLPFTPSLPLHYTFWYLLWPVLLCLFYFVLLCSGLFYWPVLLACSTLFYFTFAIASSPFTLPSQVFSILHCNTVFTVIRFLLLFHLYVLYLALICSHLPFIFTYSNHSISITAI